MKTESSLNMINTELSKYKSVYHDWHMHTIYTDGQNTVFELAKEAKHKSLNSIAITEHVRKNLTYNFDDLIDEIKEAEKKIKIKILIGCEAKVLNTEGELDVRDEVIQKCDFVLGAFHKFPVNKEAYFNAIIAMLKNPKVTIWAHPFRFAYLNKIEFSNDELKQIFGHLKKTGKIFEINSRIPPSNKVLQYIKMFKIDYCFGSDSHQKGNLLSTNFYNIWKDKLWK